MSAPEQNEKFVPGLFACPKCAFVLVSNTLYMKSGTIGANNKPQECSNGCGPMWRVSWRQHAESLQSHLETTFEQGLRRAAKICEDYAHSGMVGMMRRQVAYACERRILEEVSTRATERKGSRGYGVRPGFDSTGGPVGGGNGSAGVSTPAAPIEAARQSAHEWWLKNRDLNLRGEGAFSQEEAFVAGWQARGEPNEKESKCFTS